MRLPDVLRRTPHVALFLLAAAVQIALVAAMVADRAAILRSGADVLLQTAPVDPRDLLRGDYVVLRYDISTVAAGALADGRATRRKGPVFVRLAPDPDGFYRAVSVHAGPVPVAPGEVLIQGRVRFGDRCGPERRSYCDRLTVAYGLESYFVPEGEGRAIERTEASKITVLAAVAPSGRAAIRRLMIDGKPVYDEPMF